MRRSCATFKMRLTVFEGSLHIWFWRQLSIRACLTSARETSGVFWVKARQLRPQQELPWMFCSELCTASDYLGMAWDSTKKEAHSSTTEKWFLSLFFCVAGRFLSSYCSTFLNPGWWITVHRRHDIHRRGMGSASVPGWHHDILTHHRRHFLFQHFKSAPLVRRCPHKFQNLKLNKLGICMWMHPMQ